MSGLKQISHHSKALITGGAGFIGSHLVDALISKGLEVTVLDNLSRGSLDNLRQSLQNSKFMFIRGDLKNFEETAKAVKNCDAIPIWLPTQRLKLDAQILKWTLKKMLLLPTICWRLFAEKPPTSVSFSLSLQQFMARLENYVGGLNGTALKL